MGAAGSVMVVGAGVSGCACGAILAAAGLDVTLVSSALDLVGLPSYGPEVWVGGDCIERCTEALDELPSVLRDVWVDACVVPEGPPSCVVVDRRRLSVETKRALEGFGGLKFRQGLVVDLRVGGARAGLVAQAVVGGPMARGECLELETAFGEVLCADVVVLATGLSLGGRVVVGEQEMVGGRYGETPSDRLMESLTALGAEWAEATQFVGPRRGAAAPDTGEMEALRDVSPRKGGPACAVSVDAMPLRSALSRTAEQERTRACDARRSASDAGSMWSAGLPPSPYFGAVDGLAGFQCGVDSGGMAAEGAWGAVPDGLATGEAYLVPGASGGVGLFREGAETRVAQSVRGLAIRNVDTGGRFVGSDVGQGRVWVAGRAAGASGYVESLRSGVRVGRLIVEQLRSGCGLAVGGHGEQGPMASGDRADGGAGVRT
jgi:hypothetical protein